MPFDPEAPFAGAPEPWAPSSPPELRTGPPYLMSEMIAAEPAFAARLVRRLTDDAGPAVRAVADTIRATVKAGDPVVSAGCGTSEHAAMATAAVLGDALGDRAVWRVHRRQALDLVGEPPAAGLVVAISHEGGTWATNEALHAARGAGARTALITVSARSPGAAHADHVIETGELDRSWCHTVGYLSPVVAALALAAALRDTALDPSATRALLEASGDPTAATSAAAALAGCDRLIVAGGASDQVTALELALKIEEGAGIPARALHLETLRHGHLAAADERTGLILILTASANRDAPLRERAKAALRAAQALGLRAAAILGERVSAEVPEPLTPAGRLTTPQPGLHRPIAESILGSAIPLQLLAERLARARGRNPDLIGRDDARQAAAADS